MMQQSLRFAMDHDDDTTPLWIWALRFDRSFSRDSQGGHLDLPSRRACTPMDFELTLSPAALSLFLFSLIYIYCKAFTF